MASETIQAVLAETLHVRGRQVCEKARIAVSFVGEKISHIMACNQCCNGCKQPREQGLKLTNPIAVSAKENGMLVRYATTSCQCWGKHITVPLGNAARRSIAPSSWMSTFIVRLLRRVRKNAASPTRHANTVSATAACQNFPFSIWPQVIPKANAAGKLPLYP